MTKSEMLNHIVKLSEDNIRLRECYPYVTLFAQARGCAYAALHGID